MREIWDVYDVNRNKTGKTVFRDESMAIGEYHLVVNIWIMNSRGEILLQKRSMEKPLGAGLWCCTGGSALIGEGPMEAFVREMAEELGVFPDVANAEIALFEANEKRHYHKAVWFLRQDIADDEFHLQSEEVDAVQWITLDELIDEMNDTKVFWEQSYMDILIPYLKEKKLGE